MTDPMMKFGLLTLVLGSIFLTVFGVSADFTSPLHFRDSDPIVGGILLSKEKTNSSASGERIYEYQYRYAVDSLAYLGKSFAIDEGSVRGAAVQVQYASGDPGMSRLRGHRAAPSGLAVVAATAIFPAIGLFMVGMSVLRSVRYLRLMRNGVLTVGRVTRHEKTHVEVGGKRVFKVIFEFMTPDGSVHEASIRSTDTTRLGDEATEPMVYDVARPEQAVLLDALPAQVRKLLERTQAIA